MRNRNTIVCSQLCPLQTIVFRAEGANLTSQHNYKLSTNILQFTVTQVVRDPENAAMHNRSFILV